MTGYAEQAQVMRERAERMRREPTRSEACLWERLRKRPSGVFFWHQHVIANRFIADFFCPAASLVIEVDGDAHEGREAQDLRRDAAMHAMGLRVLRFRNLEVLADVDVVMARIADVVKRPAVLGRQREQEARARALAEHRTSVLVEQAKSSAKIRQRPSSLPTKALFRCNWCLASFISALAPSPACRRCPGSPVIPVCRSCEIRQALVPNARCRPCLEAAEVARSAVGAPNEQVSRRGHHRVRKV